MRCSRASLVVLDAHRLVPVEHLAVLADEVQRVKRGVEAKGAALLGARPVRLEPEVGVVRLPPGAEHAGAGQRHRHEAVAEAQPVDIDDAAQPPLVDDDVLCRDVVEKRPRPHRREVGRQRHRARLRAADQIDEVSLAPDQPPPAAIDERRHRPGPAGRGPRTVAGQRVAEASPLGQVLLHALLDGRDRGRERAAIVAAHGVEGILEIDAGQPLQDQEGMAAVLAAGQDARQRRPDRGQQRMPAARSLEEGPVLDGAQADHERAAVGADHVVDVVVVAARESPDRAHRAGEAARDGGRLLGERALGHLSCA